MKKSTLILIVLLLLSSRSYALNVFTPSQGGTGVGTTVAGNVGKCLQVSSVSPLTYTFADCSGGTGTFPFTSQSWGNSTSTTLGLLNGFLSTASSTVSSTLNTKNIVASAGGVFGTGRSSTAFAYASKGPDTGSHQGYATDGTKHYTFDTTELKRHADDASWTVEASNSTPFDGLTDFDHLGDGEYYNGKLYVPAEKYVPGNSTLMSIFVFDATTLARDSVNDVSAQGYEAASVTIDASNNLIYMVSFDDGTKIAKYRLSDFSFVGWITLTQTITNAQGIANKNGLLYVGTDDGKLYEIDPSTGITVQCFDTIKMVMPGSAVTTSGNEEGIDFTGSQLKWLVDGGVGERKIYSYSTGTSLPTTAATGRIQMDLGTLTTSISPIRITETRNSSDIAFPGIYYSVNQTAEESSGYLLRILGGVNGTTNRMSLSNSGTLTIGGGFIANSNVLAAATDAIGMLGRGKWMSSANGRLEALYADGVTPATVTSALAKGNFIVGNDAGFTQATSSIYISSNGYFGVGTTSPLARFSVSNYSTGANTSPLFVVASSTGTSATSTALMVTSTGSIGMGTASPLYKFHINAGDYDGIGLFDGLTSVPSVKIAQHSYTGHNQGYITLYDATASSVALISLTTMGNSYINTNNFGVGTTTPTNKLTVTDSSSSQISLSAGGGIAQWAMRNAGGNFYLSTTTVAGTATTSISALEIAGAGFGTTTVRGLNISGQATSTSNVGLNITTGCFAIGGTCIGSGTGTYGDVNVNSYIHASTTIPKLYTTNTWAGVNDYSSAISLSIPTVADPTVNANGEIAVNSTTASSSIMFYDGAAERAIYPEIYPSTIYASSTLDTDGDYSPTATTTYTVANYPRAMTLKSLYCKVSKGSGSAWMEVGNGTASSTVNCTTSGAVSTTEVEFTMRQNYMVSFGKAATNAEDTLFTVTEQIRTNP